MHCVIYYSNNLTNAIRELIKFVHLKESFYTAFGLTIRTNFELYSIPRSNGSIEAELTITKVQNRFNYTLPSDKDFEITEVEEGFIYQVKNIATFLIRRDNHIVIEQTTDKDDLVECVLMEGVLNTFLSYKGFYVFNGAAVLKNDTAQLLMGIPGVGISTIAAGLREKGYQLLSDNKIIIQSNNEGLALIPSLTYSKIWNKDIDRFNLKEKTKHSVRSELSKFYIDLIPFNTASSYPIEKNTILKIKARGSYKLGIAPTSGIPLIEHLRKYLYSSALGEAKGNNVKTFNFLSDFATSIEHNMLERPSSVFDVNKVIGLICKGKTI